LVIDISPLIAAGVDMRIAYPLPNIFIPY